MSRTQYVKQLERSLNASQMVINDLTEEVYQLKMLLRETARNERHEPEHSEAQ